MEYGGARVLKEHEVGASNGQGAAREGSKKLPQVAYDKYIEAWRKRTHQQREEGKTALRKAKAYAIECSKILVEKFGAKRVYLFGSVKEGYFGWDSDIDLAVEGLEPHLYFKALVGIHKVSDDLKVDLIPLEDCASRETIIEEGELIPG